MLSRNGIKSTRVKRMTSQKPFTGQKCSPNCAISKNSLIGILRTGWIETTCRSQDRRQYNLIKLDKKQYGLFNDHFFAKSSNIFSSEENACFEDIAKTFFLAIMLISHLPKIRSLFNRKYSRIKRLILFRMAAHPIFFVTVMPSLVVSDPPGPTATIKCSFLNFWPFLDKLTNSVRLRILADFSKWYLFNQISRDRFNAC